MTEKVVFTGKIALVCEEGLIMTDEVKVTAT